jgi:hypothetical protein
MCMDVLDAGVYVAKWEADVPKGLQTVLWGPLQAKEMGFDGWECQDGGETGFVYHRPHIRLAAGFGTSTLIVVNRLKKAYLTMYFGGYPSDVPTEQRKLDAQKIVSAAQGFLTRLAKTPISFHFQGEISLVDNSNDAIATQAAAAAPVLPVATEAPPAKAVFVDTRTDSDVWEV